MREQSAGGHIFNMDGAGDDGGATPRFAAYGAPKRSLAQLSKSLQAVPRILCGTLNIRKSYEDATVKCTEARMRRVYRCLSSDSEDAGGAEAPEHQQCGHPQPVAWNGDHRASHGRCSTVLPSPYSSQSLTNG